MSQEMQATLAPWMARLDRVIAVGFDSRLSDSGDVDGYDGLGRTGSLDRLMVSDWLLAQDYPDEFLRRFSDRELSYYQFAFEQPANSSQITVLFDVGPDQLGSPRLAHIALFVLFARRAAVSGVSFRWGIAQDRDTTLYSDIGSDAVQRLLAARSFNVIDEDALQRWQAVLAADSSVWWVTAVDAMPGRATQRVCIKQLQDSQLSLSIVADFGQRELLLACPATPVCVRLLRDPYREELPTPALSKHVQYLFSSDARRLFVCSAGVTHAYGLNPQVQSGKVKPMIIEYPADDTAVCLQFAKRQIVQLNATALSLQLRSRNGNRSFNLPAQWSTPAPDTAIRNCWVVRMTGTNRLYFIDTENVLWYLDLLKDGMQPIQVQTEVLAALMADGVLRYWVASDEALIECRIHTLSAPTEFTTTDWGSIDVELLRAGTSRFCVIRGEGKHSAVGVIDTEHFFYSVRANRRFDQIELPNDLHCRGIAMVDRKLQLVSIDNSGLKLVCQNVLDGNHVTHFESEQPIDVVCCASNLPLVACRSESTGNGFVVNLATSSVMLNVVPDGE